ncbi:UNVERIFIED_CONTAM: hypothetical protein Sangu_1702900 [Sesamum angustifolium]|uniref:Endonuclease/exonuclease/phosphatase n=1 Tax=Sesamum angustifolium TaxID=2727405 RepID=A0AAW2MJ85_9LAMI
MKLLVWNYQGLWLPWTVRTLKELINLHRPGLVFLYETKCKARRCDRVKDVVNYNGIKVDSMGKVGCLLLLWRKDVKVCLQSFSVHLIDCSVKSSKCPKHWRFTGFYGYPEVTRMKKGWNLIRRLSQVLVRPWLCTGAYNKVLEQYEKSKGPFLELSGRSGTPRVPP